MKNHTLGSLEFKVMKVVWRKEKCTVRDVVKDLRKEKPLAYTTVMTVMDKLYKKDFLKRVKVKKTYHYKTYASENLFIRSFISKTLQSLISEHGKLIVLSSLIPVQINLPITKLNSLPITSFLTSLVLGLFAISFWDLLQGLTLFGSFDYLELILVEPKIIFSHTSLIFGALFESLPRASLLTTLILFIFMVIVVQKMTKLLKGNLI